MERLRRTDRLTLDAKRTRRNSAGVLVVPASVARTGVQEYRRADGSVVREYRPDTEVFAAEALESLRGAPVTIGHPPDGVAPHTLTQLSVGLVSDRDPARAERDGRSWVDTALAITSPAVQRQIEAGELVEISLGYDAVVDPTPGVTPDGQHYDCIQRQIAVNHTALLPPGHARAGREARLRLDSHEDLCNTPVQDTKMSEPQKPIIKVRIDGVDVVEHSPEHFALVSKQLSDAQAALSKATADLAAAKADGVKLQAKADSLEADLAKAKAIDVDALADARATARQALRDAAAPHLPKDYSFAGKSDAQVKRDAIGAEAVKRVDARPEAERSLYLDAAFDHVIAAGPKGPSYVAPVAQTSQTQTVKTDSEVKSLEQISADMFNAGRKG